MAYGCITVKANPATRADTNLDMPTRLLYLFLLQYTIESIFII